MKKRPLLYSRSLHSLKFLGSFFRIENGKLKMENLGAPWRRYNNLQAQPAPQLSIFNCQFSISQRVHITPSYISAYRGASSRLDFDFAPQHNKCYIVEGFLCQPSEQVRSLQGVNEELAMRWLVQKSPTRCANTRRSWEYGGMVSHHEC